MYTQITCPNCGTPYTAEVHQVIDVGRNPELKQLLLAGQLNVAVCPSCGAAGQIGTAMVYHDPKHELFMIYAPQELQMDQMQREQYIGQLTRQVVDNTPAEQRRAYMFQPRSVLSMQSFMENVLETEGITKEMIQRQRKQAELLNTLARADADVAEYLLRERKGEIDENFFAMLRTYIENANRLDDNSQLIPLLNLQAKLMTETEVGRQIEKRQVALHGLNQEAKAEGGLNPRTLLKHVLKYQDDPAIVRALVQVGAGALTYDFFTGLTAEIDKQHMAGKADKADRLTALRSDLLAWQAEMERQSRQILEKASQTLDAILAAPDIKKAARANIDKLDEAFLYVLAAEISRAEQSGQTERLQKLTQVHEVLDAAMDSQAPPEVQLINDLVNSEGDDAMRRLLDDNQDLLSEDMVTVIDMLLEQMSSTSADEVVERLQRAKGMIALRLT